jgi:sugar phosphate isomerase/epimerase
VHPRVSLHQVAFLDQPATTFVEHCRGFGVPMTLVTSLLMQPGVMDEVCRALDSGGPRVSALNHPFATTTDLERDDGSSTEKLLQAIDLAAALGARTIYLITGGRGALSWEQAAIRFAELIAPCRVSAEARGVALLVENASAFNADIHIAHTLADTLALAEQAGIGVCVDLHACWVEATLPTLIERAMPIIGLVQVSDYVLGDRCAPCRAVPGDGAIPLADLVGDVLSAGYGGLFDLELVGPRISSEGAADATRRGLAVLSALLSRLGA